MSLNAVHAPFAVVHTGIELIILICLLKYGDADVGLIAYHADDDRTLPFSAPCRRYSFRLQLTCDFRAGLAFHDRCKHTPYDLSLFHVDDHFAVHVFVAVGGSADHIGAVLKALLDAPFVVFREGAGFVFCKARHDGKHQFALHLARVDVFLFKENINAHCVEPADSLHTLHRVAGEAADGLYKDVVDKTAFAVRKHTEQTVALGHLCAGDPFVVIKSGELPVGAVFDDLFVMLLLCVKTDELVGGVRGDSGIGRHAQLFCFLRHRIDFCYPFHCLASCP